MLDCARQAKRERTDQDRRHQWLHPPPEKDDVARGITGFEVVVRVLVADVGGPRDAIFPIATSCCRGWSVRLVSVAVVIGASRAAHRTDDETQPRGSMPDTSSTGTRAPSRASSGRRKG